MSGRGAHSDKARVTEGGLQGKRRRELYWGVSEASVWFEQEKCVWEQKKQTEPREAVRLLSGFLFADTVEEALL